MYDFKNILMDNEKILWEGKPEPKKGGKNLSGLLIFLGIMSLFQFLLIDIITSRIQPAGLTVNR